VERSGAHRRGHIDVDGWIHVGDLTVMTKDGYFNIVGRINDIAIRGGDNVYTREIEEFLHPPRRAGRPGDRRARRPLRRRADGVGPAAPGADVDVEVCGRSAKGRSPTSRRFATSGSSTSSR
jgi:acyl-CoA synthetase (AMP-forming)/AMP-acid ligase II